MIERNPCLLYPPRNHSWFSSDPSGKGGKLGTAYHHPAPRSHPNTRGTRSGNFLRKTLHCTLCVPFILRSISSSRVGQQRDLFSCFALFCGLRSLVPRTHTDRRISICLTVVFQADVELVTDKQRAQRKSQRVCYVLGLGKQDQGK